MMKRTAALLLSATLALASALPVLGTRMVCGPDMAAMANAVPTDQGGASCEATPTCTETLVSTGLRAGSCCRIAPIDEAGALQATLSDHRAPSGDEGRLLVASALPASPSHGVALVSLPPVGGSPPTVPPTSPTRTVILRN